MHAVILVDAIYDLKVFEKCPCDQPTLEETLEDDK